MLAAAVIAFLIEGAPAFEQHFAPAEDLERLDVALIEQASERIDLAAYVLADLAVIEALDDAAARGVKVRIFRDRAEGDRGRAGEAIAALERDGAEIRYKESGRPLMHLKSFCIDGRTLRFGAANFSHSGLTAQENDLDIRRGSGVCAAFEASFERMWNR